MEENAALGLKSFHSRPSQGKMFVAGWLIWWIFLTPQGTSFGFLEISGYDRHEVICPQGLSDCTMEDEIPLIITDSEAVVVQSLTPHIKLCCKDSAPCTLCLLIDTEISIHPRDDMGDEHKSMVDEEDYSEEASNPKASMTLCFMVPSLMPTCKKVEFTVNHTALTQPNQAKVSVVIIKPAGISYSSRVTVYSKSPYQTRDVVVPSSDEVCNGDLQGRLEECYVPRLSCTINQETNQVELQRAGSNESFPTVCVQYEKNGRCQRLNRRTIPLDSVTPCMCFQAWDEDDQRSRRSQSCPFNATDFVRENVWKNMSVSVSQGQLSRKQSVLWWNISAPCRLEGEVWPCHRENSCREMKGFRQQLTNGIWTQNREGHWVNTGLFEGIDLELSPCVMVKVKGMGRELPPVCFDETERHRWSLLVIGVVLLVCVTSVTFYLLHDFVKKWVWSWRHGGFVEIGKKRHVVLLSPPDGDDAVSQSVCRLGSMLSNQGFSVSVDQWSRKEQCALGPLPWLHSQLLQLNGQGGRVVLVLTRKALERAEEWTLRQKEVIKTDSEDRGLPRIASPYSDVFMASLCLIQADRLLGRAGERFLLVNFDSRPHSNGSLPELLQGLQLFQLPSQTQALLTELTVGGAGSGSSQGMWTGWKWKDSSGWRARKKEEPDQKKEVNCKYVGLEEKVETNPLKYQEMPC